MLAMCGSGVPLLTCDDLTASSRIAKTVFRQLNRHGFHS